MPCTLDLAEFNSTVDAIETIENLAAEEDTDLLGMVLLLDIRRHLVHAMLEKVGACDDANAASPIKRADCPAYKIMRERIAARVAKRFQSDMAEIILDDAQRNIDDGPDGFI